MDDEAKVEGPDGGHPDLLGSTAADLGGGLLGLGAGDLTEVDPDPQYLFDPGLVTRTEREFSCLGKGHLHRPAKARVHLWWANNPRTIRLCPVCGHRILDGDELIEALTVVRSE